MNEVEIDGHSYLIGKLTAMQQFHITRKLSPLLPPLIPILIQAINEKKLIEKDKARNKLDFLDVLAPLLEPFTEGLSSMEDEHFEYVVDNCLSVLKRKTDIGDNWVKVWNVSGKVAMFADLNDVSKLLPLIIRVLTDSLHPFIQGLLTTPQTTLNPNSSGDPYPTEKTGS